MTVLKQDTDDYLFAPGEMRYNAHHRRWANVSTFSILDELEDMRTLATGHVELELSWPAVDEWGLAYDAYEPMHWTQDLSLIHI